MNPEDVRNQLDALGAGLDGLDEDMGRFAGGRLPGRIERPEERLSRLEKRFTQLCDAIKPSLLDMQLLTARLKDAPEPTSVKDIEAVLVARLDSFVQTVVDRMEAFRTDLDLQRSLSEGVNLEFRKNLDTLRAEFQGRLERDEENQRRLQETLKALQRPAEPDVQDDIRLLQKQILQLRQAQDSELLELLRNRLPAEEAPADEEPPEGLVDPERLLDAAERLAALLRRDPPATMEQKLVAEIDALRALAADLLAEAKLQERATDLLRMLLPRLLEGAPAERLHRRARHYVFVHLPDLLEDLEDLGRRELPPEQVGPLHHALEGILEDMGLEEVRPARGETLKASEHSLLRVERTPEPGMEGRIAQCLRAGLRLRSSGELVRKAEVSVYP